MMNTGEPVSNRALALIHPLLVRILMGRTKLWNIWGSLTFFCRLILFSSPKGADRFLLVICGISSGGVMYEVAYFVQQNFGSPNPSSAQLGVR